MKLVEKINLAFASRSLTKDVCVAGCLDEDELNDVEELCSYHREELTCDLVEDFFDVFSLLKPEVFIYYLCGIMTSSIKESCPGLLIHQSIVSQLDRVPNPGMWDNFFLSRWPLLTENECEAVKEWIVWLGENAPDLFKKSAIERGLNTLSLIKEKKVIPITK